MEIYTKMVAKIAQDKRAQDKKVQNKNKMGK